MSTKRNNNARATSDADSRSSTPVAGAAVRDASVAAATAHDAGSASPGAEAGAPHIRIEMVSQPRYLAGARSMIASVAQRFGFSECDCGQIALALDEALCNVIKHGYERRSDGWISISVWPIDDPPRGVCIQIDDRGRQVDVSAIRSRNLDDIRPGGLGVFLINQIMDEAHYSRREAGGMRLTMLKYLNSDGAPAADDDDAGAAIGADRQKQQHAEAGACGCSDATSESRSVEAGSSESTTGRAARGDRGAGTQCTSADRSTRPPKAGR